MLLPLLIIMVLLQPMRGCLKWVMVLSIIGWLLHRDNQFAQDLLDGIRLLEQALTSVAHP